MGFQGYDLKDNPKKSWKSLGSNGNNEDTTTSSASEFQCKVWCKQFESTKTLFGHMRHHSAKERKAVKCQECGRKFKSLKALNVHMSLHPLKSITVKTKRSTRSRYINNGPNESSAFVEIDPDTEDDALCLIMLSRGVKNWTEFNCSWESCDNKEILQSPLGYGADFDSFASGSMNVLREKNISECKESDSGILSEKEKDDESGFEFHEMGIKGRFSGEMMNLGCIEVEPGQDLMEGLELTGLGSTKSSSCRDAMFDLEPGGDALNKLISSPLNSEMTDDSQNQNKYNCRICSKTFKSHQALGGHQTISRKSNTCAVEPVEDGAQTADVSSFPEIQNHCKLEYAEPENEVTSSETGLHKCLICFKVFRSSEALGGHKRSHKQPAAHLHLSNISSHVIDINLPLLHNEEASGDIGFNSCQLGTHCKTEALLSLVAK